MQIFKDILTLTEARRKDIKYTEKLVKGAVDKVIAELEGQEGAGFSKLAKKYDRLEKALKRMKEKRDELNVEIKAKMEEMFDYEDYVLTRIIDTTSFVLQISKNIPMADKTEINYEKICEELAQLLPEDVVKKITDAYTRVIPAQEKSAKLTVKGKEVKEALIPAIGKIATKIKALLMTVGSRVNAWVREFDHEFAALKAKAGVK